MRRKHFASLFGRSIFALNLAAKPSHRLRGEPMQCLAEVAKRLNVGSRKVATSRFALDLVANVVDRQHFASPKWAGVLRNAANTQRAQRIFRSFLRASFRTTVPLAPDRQSSREPAEQRTKQCGAKAKQRTNPNW